MNALSYGSNQIMIKDSYHYKDYIKETICGTKWDSNAKAWIAEFSTKNIEKLKCVGCTFSKELEEAYIKQKQKELEVHKEKMADDSKEIEPMPIKVKPYEHQIKGYNIACKLMSIFKKE